MNLTYQERYKRVEKFVEDNLGFKRKRLNELSQKIKNRCENTFSAKSITGDYNFWKIYNNATCKEESDCPTLAEKCIRRNYDIKHLQYKFDKENPITDELENMDVLFVIIERILPLEILWAMGYEDDDDFSFTEDEQIIYDYLKNIANFYLSTTEKYKKLHDELKKSKVKSL